MHGAYQHALTSYGKVLQLEPKNAHAFKYKGDTLFALKRYKEAFSAYQLAEQHDPTYSAVMNKQAINLVQEGNAFLQQNNSIAALYLFELALLFNPKDADAYLCQGDTLFKLGRYHEALDLYEQCIQLIPKYAKQLPARIYCTKGEVFYAMQDYEKALVEYKEAYKLDPSSSRKLVANKVLLYVIGKFFYKNKDYQRALLAFNTGILYDPKNMLCYLAEGNCLYKLERYLDAFQDYEMAWHIDPPFTIQYLGSKMIIPGLGKMLYNLEYYHEAHVTYQMAIAFDPLNKNAYLALAKKLVEEATYLFEGKAYADAINFDPTGERTYQEQFTSGEYTS